MNRQDLKEHRRQQRKHNIKDIIINFFNKKETRKTSFLAYKAQTIEDLFDLINESNCDSPEKAFKTLNKMLGIKINLQMIEEQADKAE